MVDDESAAEWTPTPVSSRKLNAGNRRGEDGKASETRRCLSGEATEDIDAEVGSGKGALNENVEVEGSCVACSEVAAIVEGAKDVVVSPD